MKLPADIRLTEKQAEFVRLIVDGVPQGIAAERAGYSHPVQNAPRFMRNPVVQGAIRQEVNRRLVAEAAPVAYNVLLKLARDETCPPAVRRNCAKDLLGLAGFVEPKAIDPETTQEKPLTERTTQELHDLVAKLESELAGRATEVNADDLQE